MKKKKKKVRKSERKSRIHLPTPECAMTAVTRDSSSSIATETCDCVLLRTATKTSECAPIREVTFEEKKRLES